MAFLDAPLALAAPPVIDGVIMRKSPEGTVIHITFNTILRYQSHSPRTTGNVLVIDLRPVFSAGSTADLNVSESRAFTPSRENPLAEVRFDGSLPTAPKLSLSFVRPVTFRVEAAPDFQSIDVILKKGSAARPPAPPPAKPDQKQRVPKAGTAPRTAAPARDDVPDGPYVLNLSSQQAPFEAAALAAVPAFHRYRLYTYRFEKNHRTWYRLRLGFFASRETAKAVRKTLPRAYANAWIDRASPQERKNSGSIALFRPQASAALAEAQPARAPGTPPARRQIPAAAVAANVQQPDGSLLPAVSDKRLDRIWEEARRKMVDRDYGRAIQLYTKVLQLPPNRYTQQAQEFLGLARERNGQLAHATAEYTRYLELYPKGEGADRVRQRLAGLLTAKSEPQQKLRKAAREPDQGGWDTQFFGSFSQGYTYRATVVDPNGRQTTQSDLLSDLDFTFQTRSDQQDIRAVFVGGHGLNFLDQNDFNESRISALYVDGTDRKTGLSARVGRQTRNSSGILGRFDGGLAGYRVSPKVKLNIASGLPVDSVKNLDVGKGRYFYGGSADLGPFWGGWNFNVFAIQQIADSLLDRRAVGGEIRYLKGGTALFGLLDYDVHFNALNIALANATFRVGGGTTLNVSADVRKSPILTTTNALQGQTVRSVADLRTLFSDDEIRRLAEDRTAFSQTYTVGVSQPLDARFQLNGDVTATKLSDTKASGGVEASPGTGYEFYYSAQLTGTGLFSKSDVTIFGLRFADTDRSKTVTVDLNVRYALGEKWRMNPRLRADYRFNNQDGGSRTRIRPFVRLDYRIRKWANLELECGGEWASEKFAANPNDPTTDGLTTADWFVTASYRVDF